LRTQAGPFRFAFDLPQENTMSRNNAALIVPTVKPRNPLAVVCRLRRAGIHRAGGGALRQQAQRRLRRELGAAPADSP
jgi:hypothetical protein